MSDADDDLTVTGQDEDGCVQQPRARSRKKKKEAQAKRQTRKENAWTAVNGDSLLMIVLLTT